MNTEESIRFACLLAAAEEALEWIKECAEWEPINTEQPIIHVLESAIKQAKGE